MLLAFREEESKFRVFLDGDLIGHGDDVVVAECHQLLEAALEVIQNAPGGGGITEVEFVDFGQGFREILHNIGYGEQYTGEDNEDDDPIVRVSLNDFMGTFCMTVRDATPEFWYGPTGLLQKYESILAPHLEYWETVAATHGW